jgi:hypothetical protein
MTKLTHTLATTGIAAMFLLAGCGPESTTATSSTTSAPTSKADADSRGPGNTSNQMDAIQACLKKAGLEDKLPARGTSERPSAPPTGQPPKDQAPSGADRRAGGPFADKDVQKALKACGLDVPEPPSGPPTS